MTRYIVTGMSCAACQAHVEKAVSKLPNVKSVNVSLLTNSMTVEGDVSSADVISAVEKAGYQAKLAFSTDKSESPATQSAEEEFFKDRETPKLIRRLIRSLIFVAAIMYITMGHNMFGFPLPPFLSDNYTLLAVIQMLLAATVMYINRAFFISGSRSLFQKAPNMDTLVALGSSVSFVWSVYVIFKLAAGISDAQNVYHTQLYFESAAMIPALITVGKTLESFSKGRTTDALKSLIKMAPKFATVERGGQQITVSIDEINIGDVFIVKPGESIPADGVIIEGSTTVDESALTGESVPADKFIGDTVSAATINQSGYFRAKASRVGKDTAFSQIIKTVSDAAATKAPIARIADRVSGVFVPAVIGIAVLVFLLWIFRSSDVVFALERAVSVLVVSCPCALGLATPVAVIVGSGIGAKNGILFKTGESLETTGKIKIAVLDKTGTVTVGKPEVTDIFPEPGISRDDLISTAYLLESKSEHPLAKAVVNFINSEPSPSYPVTDWRALPGNGISASQNGQTLYAGSGKFIRSVVNVGCETEKLEIALSEEGKTPLFFAKADKLLGIIAVADVIKTDSAQAVRELQDMGIEVVMLTGDNERTAKAIGKQAGISNVIAGVLPDEKESVIRTLKNRGTVAMVGDGINDAPALVRADVGIAIGTGTDIAVDSADVVLMNSKLTDVSCAVRLSRKTLLNIRENLFWAFIYNAVLIPMAAGLFSNIQMNPMFGAAAMSLSSFTVCMNALRLNLFDPHNAKRGRKTRIIAENSATPSSLQNNSAALTLKVGGMMCNNCERHVVNALKQIKGITGVSADHTTGTVTVTYTFAPDEALIKNVVEELGYEYLGSERSK